MQTTIYQIHHRIRKYQYRCFPTPSTVQIFHLDWRPASMNKELAEHSTTKDFLVVARMNTSGTPASGIPPRRHHCCCWNITQTFGKTPLTVLRSNATSECLGGRLCFDYQRIRPRARLAKAGLSTTIQRQRSIRTVQGHRKTQRDNCRVSPLPVPGHRRHSS